MEKPVQVSEDAHYHLIFRELDVGVVAVRAVVDDAVHVQIKVIHDRHNRGPSRHVDQRVALAEPSIKLGDACDQGHMYPLRSWETFACFDRTRAWAEG